MATDVRKLAQDAAYVTVGVGVLAFQRAQVARRETRAKIESQVKEARGNVLAGAEVARTKIESRLEEAKGLVQPVRQQIRSRVEPVTTELRSRVEPLAEQVQDRLPETLAKLVEVGRTRLGAGTAA